MASADELKPAQPDNGWYGKLPAAGDFVHRRVSREWIASWDRWQQHGLAALSHLPEKARREFRGAPIWNFAIPAAVGGGAVRLGCLAPSHDRVGRIYPLVCVHTLTLEAYRPRVLEAAADYYRASGAALLTAVRHGCDVQRLDDALRRASGMLCSRRGTPTPEAADGGGDILAVLNSGRTGDTDWLPPAANTLSWPELPRYFNPASHTSYWWTNQADGAPLQTYLHGGGLNTTLFTRLFAPSASLWR